MKCAANKSDVGVLVQRATRFVLLAKMPYASAESALVASTSKLNQIAEQMRQTLPMTRTGRWSKIVNWRAQPT